MRFATDALLTTGFVLLLTGAVWRSRAAIGRNHPRPSRCQRRRGWRRPRCLSQFRPRAGVMTPRLFFVFNAKWFLQSCLTDISPLLDVSQTTKFQSGSQEETCSRNTYFDS